MNNSKLMNVILWALIVGIVAASLMYFFVNDKYDAVSQVTFEDNGVEIPLTKEFKSEKILNDLIKENNWNVSMLELEKAVDIKQKDNTYSIHVSFNNKEDALEIANRYAQNVENIFTDSEVMVNKLSKASEIKNVSTLPKVLYITASVLIGVLIGVLINVIKNPNNRRISEDRPDSLKKYPVLGTIKVY